MSDVVAERPPRTIVQQEPFAIRYSDDTILLKEVRLSYPHIVKPYRAGGKYQLKALMPKADEYKSSSGLVIREINRVLKAQNVTLPADRKFMKDGDTMGDRPEHAGQYIISASEEKIPVLRGRGKDPKTGRAKIVTVEEAGRLFYGGCWANVLIKPWFQNNTEYGKRVNANLVGVQFVKDDEAFGEGRISDDAIDESFGAIDDDDSGYDDGLGDADGL